MIGRLVDNWVYGGVLAGVLLLLLAPMLTQSWSTALTATFLFIPLGAFGLWQVRWASMRRY